MRVASNAKISGNHTVTALDSRAHPSRRFAQGSTRPHGRRRFMGRGWFICGGSSKDTVPRPPLRESEGDEVSVKPAPAGEDAPADESLKVHVDLNGVQVYFKIKRSTRMHKVFSALAKKQGVEVTSLRVTFRGARVGGLDNADIVGLRDGDQLDAEIIEPEPAPPVAPPPPARNAAPAAPVPADVLIVDSLIAVVSVALVAVVAHKYLAA